MLYPCLSVWVLGRGEEKRERGASAQEKGDRKTQNDN